VLYTWWVISDNEHSKERLTSNDFVNSFHKNFTRAPVCWWKFKLNNTFIYLAALKSWGDWKFAHRRCKNSTQKSYSAAPSSGDNCLLQLCSRSGTLCEKEKWCICVCGCSGCSGESWEASCRQRGGLISSDGPGERTLHPPKNKLACDLIAHWHFHVLLMYLP